MNCPRCNAPNPEGSAFCNRCGLQLPMPMQNQNYQQTQQNTQMNQYQYENPNTAYQMNMPNKPPKILFYRKTWFIVLMCIFLPPIGIILLWVGKKPMNKIARITLTVFLGLWTIFLAIPTDEDSEDRESEQRVSVVEKREEEKAEQKKDEKKEKEKKKEDPEKEKQNEFEYGDCTVKYLSHEITENDMGETILVVYYDFANHGDEPISFDYFVTGKAFQNGVEIESSYFHANEESKNSEREIQKGANVTVADSYVLGKSRDNVTIEFRPFNLWSDKLLMSMELALE